MGPLTTVLAGILAAVIISAAWMARNQHRLESAAIRSRRALQRSATSHLGASGMRGMRLLTRYLGGRAVTVLTVGLITVCGLSALFEYLSDSVQEYDGIALVDKPIVAWLATHREPLLTAVMRTLSLVGGPVSATAVALIVCAAVARWVRSWLPVVTVAIGLAGFGLAAILVKVEVARQRPPLPYAATAVDGYSFPSGHALGVTTALVISAWTVTRWLIRSWTGRIAVWTIAVVLIGGVGFSRVYLGVHYPSDVIAGWLLGMIWTGSVLTCAGWWDDVRTGQGCMLSRRHSRDAAGRSAP
jgi:undecaprenyl-diphosphatase